MAGKVVAQQRFVHLGGDAGLVGVALIDAQQDVFDVLLDGRRRDAVFGVIGHLFGAAAVGFAHRTFHAAGDAVGVHDDPAFGIARCASNGLDQRGFRPQESLFIRVQNGHQTAFGNVEALAQKVDAHQHVESAQPQITQDFNAFDGVDV